MSRTDNAAGIRSREETALGSIVYDLLTVVATKLFNDAKRVPEVLAGARAGNRGDRVPDYILTQGVTNPSDFQLPEPILHPIFEPEVLVVGYYPNYGQDEDIPRYGCTLDEYIRFYSDRFSEERRDPQGRPAHKRLSDGRNVRVGHYDVVEQLLDEVLGQRNSLGTLAVYCDTVPWKSKSGPRFTSIDGGIAYHRLDDIVFALKPRVVLALGSKSRDVLIHNQRRPDMTNGRLQVPLVSSYHPAAPGNLFGQHKDQVQTLLSSALNNGTTS